MGVPLMPPVTALHSYTGAERDVGCNDMLTMEQCDWAHRIWTHWYKADWAYAQPTVVFFCVAIGLFALANGVHRYRATRCVLFSLLDNGRVDASERIGAILLLDLPAYTRGVAFLRAVTVAPVRLGRFSVMPLGSVLLIGGMVIFFAGALSAFAFTKTGS